MEQVLSGLPLVVSPLPSRHHCTCKNLWSWIRVAVLSPHTTWEQDWSSVWRNATYSRIKLCSSGHVVSKEGISSDPEKIKAVCDKPTPVLASTLRSFLGLCLYYRRFVHGFAVNAVPLHHLTEKDTKVLSWTKECDDSFHWLEQVLFQAPALRWPWLTLLQRGICSRHWRQQHLYQTLLSQKQGGEKKVIAFFTGITTYLFWWWHIAPLCMSLLASRRMKWRLVVKCFFH